jgi:hypothetical protein
MDLSRPTHPVLWFALLGGMSAYAVQLLVSFWAVPALCPVRPGAVPWVVSLTTLVTLAVAVAATVVALRARSQRRAEVQTGPAGPPPPAAGRPSAWDVSTDRSTARFLATAAAVLSALGVGLVVVHGLPLLLVEPCG